MKFCFAILVATLIFASNVQAQSLSENLITFGFTKSQVSSCDVARNESYYTTQEKDLFMLMNLFRQNPRYFGSNLDRFCEEFCIQERNFAKNASYDGVSYYASLKKDLLSMKPQPLLSPDISLFKSAQDHATDCGQNNFTGHVSSKGKSPQERIEKYSKVYTYFGECCDYSFEYAPNILLHLLVDDKVPSKGHRYAILNSHDRVYLFAGISIKPHKSYDFNAVIDFAK